jgi:hypothetical protein
MAPPDEGGAGLSSGGRPVQVVIEIKVEVKDSATIIPPPNIASRSAIGAKGARNGPKRGQAADEGTAS